MEVLKGPLLETCDEGTACREEYLKKLRETVTKIWTTTITNFKKSVVTAVEETKTIVDTRWKDLVQCEKDHPCCSYTETTWINHTSVLTRTRTEYASLVAKW